METIFLLSSCALLVVALGIILGSALLTQKNEEEGDAGKISGHEELVVACFALLRIGRRALERHKKLFVTYVLHIFVRLLRLFDRLSYVLYAKLRNTFMKNAVKNKGAVPFFWEYLKTYKQEIDREKELLEKDEE